MAFSSRKLNHQALVSRLKATVVITIWLGLRTLSGEDHCRAVSRLTWLDLSDDENTSLHVHSEAVESNIVNWRPTMQWSFPLHWVFSGLILNAHVWMLVKPSIGAFPRCQTASLIAFRQHDRYCQQFYAYLMPLPVSDRFILIIRFPLNEDWKVDRSRRSHIFNGTIRTVLSLQITDVTDGPFRLPSC